jgi:DNA-binding transcriptional LysR family regulator
VNSCGSGRGLRLQVSQLSESETIDKTEKDYCMNEKTDQPLDINAMALFARVLQHGSLSEASRRLGIPVSTVSRRISALERQLGVRLLERTTRAIRATETGHDFLPHCQQILEGLEGARAALKERQTVVTGTLRLASPPSLSELLLVPWIDGFLRLHPQVSFKVLVTDRHLDLVEDDVDISLRVGRQPESSLVFRQLIRYRHILIAAPSYLKRAARLSRPTDLKGHRLLGFTKWFEEVSWKLSNGQITERIPAKLWLGINDYEGVIRAAVSGMGVAKVPSILCRRELHRCLLVAVIPEWQFEEVDLSAYYLTRRYPSRVVELFLDHCADNAETVLDLALPGAPPPNPGRTRRARMTPDSL